MSKKAIIGSVIILLLIIAQGFGMYWAVKTKKITYKADIDQNPATLKLSPASGTYPVGTQFSINVMLNTKGGETGSTNIMITFDPAVLSVQDANPDMNGTQIKEGVLYASYAGNYVDEQQGQINLAGYNLSGSFKTTDDQIFATIDFKPIKESSGATINFLYTINDVTKSNVIETGTSADILASVTNGNYVIAAAGVPAPAPVSCGDAACNGSETCATCPADCGTCPTSGAGTSTGTGTGTSLNTGATSTSATTGPKIPLSTIIIIGLLLTLNVGIFFVGRKIIKKT